MPYKTWVHECKKYEDITVWHGVEVCPDCGKHGRYDGWHLSMVEAMSAYQQRTGLKPVGPHRTLADTLFNPRMQACNQCEGRGLIDMENDEGWIICPTCNGAQYLFNGTAKERNTLQTKILLAFPDAKST